MGEWGVSWREGGACLSCSRLPRAPFNHFEGICVNCTVSHVNCNILLPLDVFLRTSPFPGWLTTVSHIAISVNR